MSGRRTSVYIDSNVLIYAIEGPNRWQRAAGRLVRAVDAGEVAGFTSELTLAEVLVYPIRSQDKELVGIYHELLAPTASLQSLPVTRELLQQAAVLRAENRIKLADAIHLATALEQRCDVVVTGDGPLGAVAARHLRHRSLEALDALDRMADL